MNAKDKCPHCGVVKFVGHSLSAHVAACPENPDNWRRRRLYRAIDEKGNGPVMIHINGASMVRNAMKRMAPEIVRAVNKALKKQFEKSRIDFMPVLPENAPRCPPMARGESAVRKEIPWVRVYSDRELPELEKALRELPNYNQWGEDRRDKNNKPISIVAQITKTENGGESKECVLGVWFKTDDLHKRGMAIIRNLKHGAA